MSAELAVIIESVTSADGRKQWRLYQRSDGLFEHREFALDTEIYWAEVHRGPADAMALDKWLPNAGSGYFDTADRARDDAFSLFPWLSERPSQ